MSNIRSKMTQKKLKELLHYDPLTGEFTHLVARQKVRVGSRAGRTEKKGYRAIKLFGPAYKAHRLAWLYVYGTWPNDQIDHINGVKDDNRIDNLREASQSQNQANRPVSRNNKLGVKGVCLIKKTKRPTAQIRFNGKVIHLGNFDTVEQAKTAYNDAAAKFFGEFARS